MNRSAHRNLGVDAPLPHKIEFLYALQMMPQLFIGSGTESVAMNDLGFETFSQIIYVNNKKHLVHKLCYVFHVLFPRKTINGCNETLSVLPSHVI